MISDLKANAAIVKKFNEIIKDVKVNQNPKTIDDIFIPWQQLIKYDTEILMENLYTAETRNDFRGVYLCKKLDIDVFCENYEVVEWKPHNPENQALDILFHHSYGVSDNISQILKYMDILHEDIHVDFSDCVVLITPVLKKHEPKIGGWSWHNHGSYIGNFHISHEYLADEPDINMVLYFEIVKLRTKPQISK